MSETASAAWRETHVIFDQNRIPHHDQANAMANLPLGRAQCSELEEFARGIVDQQSAGVQETSGPAGCSSCRSRRSRCCARRSVSATCCT